MTIDFVNTIQHNARYLIMSADGFHRLVDFLLQAIVENKIDFHIRITVDHEVQHLRHGGTEGEEVFLCPSSVFVFTNRRAGPRIVRSSENEDDVGTVQIRHTGNKRTVGIIRKIRVSPFIS